MHIRQIFGFLISFDNDCHTDVHMQDDLSIGIHEIFLTECNVCICV